MANHIPSSVTSDAQAQQCAPHLPPEILDQIILHFISFQPGPLWHHELKELLTLSLISRAWLIATRRQLWSGYPFPFSEPNYDRFCTLRLLYSSPQYSLGLETIEELVVSLDFPFLDLRNFELRWCGEAFKGVKTITIERPVPLMGQTATFHDCLIGGFSSFSGVTTLKLNGVNFTSLNQLYDLLIALGDSLETLKCWQIRICEDAKPLDLSVTDATESGLSCVEKHSLARIRALEIDFETLFRLVHISGLKLVGLEQLTLEERLFRLVLNENSLLARLNAIGPHCGKDLRRLKLRLFPDVTCGSLQDLQGKETPEFFDLSVHAPLLQEIQVDIKILGYFIQFGWGCDL
ncbi:hypothetical protein VNI00_014432 [Paramarasmius palmivorus]|uniref:F-box domain-containing protein n=1 Tax=Paramarasmius palmivorus TaxID=297713 RepID=A0AAW0BQM9_9AGAR